MTRPVEYSSDSNTAAAPLGGSLHRQACLHYKGGPPLRHILPGRQRPITPPRQPRLPANLVSPPTSSPRQPTLPANVFPPPPSLSKRLVSPTSSPVPSHPPCYLAPPPYLVPIHNGRNYRFRIPGGHAPTE